MKKETVLPVLAWLGAAGGFALRGWELSVCYDPVSRRMAFPCPATGLLWVLAGVLAVLLLLLCRNMGAHTPEYWFFAPSTPDVILSTCSGFVLMAAGGLGLWAVYGPYRPDALAVLTFALCAAAGMAVLAYGAAVYRGRNTARLPLLLMAVCVALLVWLVTSYQQHARQPITALFQWQMLAGVCIVLAVYNLITLSMGRGNAHRTVWFCLLSVPLTGISLADGLTLPFTLVSLAAMLLLTAQSRMLLRAAFGDPRPERMCDQPTEDMPAQTEE